MYHPAVNLTNPDDAFLARLARVRGRRLTGNARDDSVFAYATGPLVSVIEHLEHGAHLFSAVIGVVLDDLQVDWRCAVDFDDAVARVGRIGRDDVKAQLVLVQNELVEYAARHGRGTSVRLDCPIWNRP